MKVVFKAFLVPGLLLMFFETSLIGRVLKCPQVDLLNIAFEGMPYILARLKLSSKAVTTVSNRLMIEAGEMNNMSKEAENKFILEQLKLILDPVKCFFSEIRTYSFLVKPLLEEILGSSSKLKSPHSHLITFIESSSDMLDFFVQAVGTHEELRMVCDEFKTFFADINDSLSVQVKQRYEQFIRDIKSKKIQSRVVDAPEGAVFIVADTTF